MGVGVPPGALRRAQTRCCAGRGFEASAAWISDIPADSVAFNATQQIRAYDNFSADPPFVELNSGSVEFQSMSGVLAQILGEGNLGTATGAFSFQPVYDDEP